MSVALHGNLNDFGIAEVFQLIGQQRKTGTLVVGEDAESIFLAFDEGCVVRGGLVGSRSEREPLGQQLVRSGYLTREQLENLLSESERSARPLSDLLLATGLIEPGVARLEKIAADDAYAAVLLAEHYYKTGDLDAGKNARVLAGTRPKHGGRAWPADPAAWHLSAVLPCIQGARCTRPSPKRERSPSLPSQILLRSALMPLVEPAVIATPRGIDAG